MAIKQEIIDELLANYQNPEDLLGDDGEVAIDIPRDRDASFEPQIIKKGQRRFNGFDDKIIKNRGHFLSDDAATKLLYLALRNAAKKWTMPARTWKQALNQFAACSKTAFLLQWAKDS